MDGTSFPTVQPLLIPIASERVTIEDGGEFLSRTIDISDVTSDPANPVPDFSDPLTVDYTRVWVLAWSARIDLVEMGGFSGDNRTNLTLEIANHPIAQVLSADSEDLVRLYIPSNGSNRYVYTGSRIVHSKEARVRIFNQTGDEVILDLDVWAKAW